MFRPSDLRCWSTEGLWCCQGGGDDDDDDTNYNGGGCGDDDYADDVDYGDDEHIIDDDYVDNGNIFYHLPGCFDKLLCICQPLHRFGLQVILTYDNNGNDNNNYADDGNDDIYSSALSITKEKL